MGLKKLVRRLPPIARRDAQLQELKRENRRLRGKLTGRREEAPEQRATQVAAPSPAELVRRSGLFDDEWYREQVPDAPDPLEHYLTVGYREGRTPHPCFDGTWYVQQAREVDEAPLLHYLRSGARARISPHPAFDAVQYAKRHPGSVRHPGGPLAHFLAGHEPPVAAVSSVPELRSPTAFVAACRDASRSLLASRGYAHLPRESGTFDADAERAFKEQLRAVELGDPPLVSVVIPTKDRAGQLPAAVRSVLEQTYERWELLVVDDGSTDDTAEVLQPFLTDPRVHLLTHDENLGVAAACNTGLAAASGTYVAYLGSDNTWEPDFLDLMVRFVTRDGHRVAYAMSALEERGGQERRRYRGMPYSREALWERNYIDHIVVLHERSLIEEVGGYDETLRRNVDWDLLARFADVTDFGFAPVIVTRYDLWETGTGRITTDESASYFFQVRQKHLVDWPAARSRDREDGLVSAVVVANTDAPSTLATVRRLLRSADGAVEVVVVDSRLGVEDATLLQVTLHPESRARVVRLSQELPIELARNAGACEARGSVLVFLPDRAWTEDGWDTPLAAALGDFSAVQPLVLTRSGTVWSAGAFRTRTGAGARLFVGLPGDVPEVRGTRSTPGVTPLAVAVRTEDFLAVEGFDPRLVQDHVGPDLSVRLARATGRPSALVGDSVVALTSSDLPATRTTRRVSATDNENRLAATWDAAPEPEMGGYSLSGFHRDEAGLRAVLGRAASDRRLRWSIKIGAPDVPRRARWGDWHFAVALRDSLERLGHVVTIDCRDSWYRDTAHLDDVTLVLRGRGRYVPNPAHVNLVWVISHPDEVSLAELRQYDAVFGASPRWCVRVSDALPEPAVPLLQCTDHRRFVPGPSDPDQAHEVLAVANARGVRPAVAAALDGGIVPSVYGFGWKGLLPRGAWKGDNVPNADLPVVYRSAGVVLNDHWDDMRREGLLSNRLFDLAACEARVVSDHLPEISAVFGDAIPTYREPGELPAVVRATLADTPEQQQRRRELGELVRREHTFDARARTLSDRVAHLRMEQPA